MFETRTGGNGNVWGRGAQQPVAKVNNFLTEEEIKRLVNHSEQFSLRLTEKEYLRGVCNHRTPDGLKDACVTLGDGSLQCEICGHIFDPTDINLTKEDIKYLTDKVNNVLQTIKMIYVNMPVDAAREYFQLVPLIDKIPELYSIAVANFMKHEQSNGWSNGNRGQGTVQLFNIFSSMFGGNVVGGQPMVSQPTYGGDGRKPLYDQYGNFVGYADEQMSMGNAAPTMPGTVGGANPAFGGGPLGAGNPETNPFVSGPAYKPETKEYAYTAEPSSTTQTTTENGGGEVTTSTTLKA